MQNGWIKLHRQIMENDIYFEERFTRAQAWIDLLLLAAHTEREVSIRNITIHLKPGELAYSQRTLAERWRWHRNTVANFIKELEKRDMIYHRKTNITTIISIINWDIYQGGVPQDEHSVPQKSAEMYHRDIPQENGYYNSNGKNNGITDGEGVPQKSTKNEKPLCTNKKDKQEAAAGGEKDFYQFVNKFVSACKNNGLFINENAATLKLKEAYDRYGFEKMRLCFNQVIDKALKKKENGERIRDVVTYGLKILESDYTPQDINNEVL